MKKVFAILIAVLLVLPFASCGGGTTPANTDDGKTESAATEAASKTPVSDTTIAASDVNLSQIFGGDGDTGVIWSKQDAATKQQLVDAARASGYTVTFGADGSTTLEGEGLRAVQKADGTWTVSSGDGTQQYGGDWPENSYTALIPKPDGTVLATSTEDGSFSAVLSGVSVDQAKTYAAKVREKGFVNNVETVDENVEGTMYYGFNADNGVFEIEIAVVQSNMSISIRTLE